MPHTANVLAATIRITFVGLKNLPDKCLPDMFQVRGTHVKKALEWLKEHNSLFANITISALRLAELPKDSVPYELILTMKLSTDVNLLYAEQDRYVPLRMPATVKETMVKKREWELCQQDNKHSQASPTIQQ